MTPVERLARALIEHHPDEAAFALERLDTARAAALFGELEPEAGTSVLARMDAAFAARTLVQLDAGDAAEILAGMRPAAAAALLRRTPTATTDALLAACPPGFATAVRAILTHPARSAGALMDPHPPSLAQDLAADASLAVIREQPDRFKHYIYVVDRSGALVGVTRLLDVVAATPERILEQVMRTPVARLYADDLEMAVLAHPGWARYASLPVVDRDDRLIGVIRDDVVRSQRERAIRTGTPVSLALSLAELFWLGLTGVTEGVASVVGREVATRNASPAEDEPR